MNSLRTLEWWHISRPWILTWCNPSLGSPKKCHRLRVICRNMKISKALVHLEITKKIERENHLKKSTSMTLRFNIWIFLRVFCLMNLFKNFSSCSGDLFYLVSFLSKETTLCIFAEKLQKHLKTCNGNSSHLWIEEALFHLLANGNLTDLFVAFFGSLYRERLTK